jgi:hypothetical protein
MFVSDIGVKPFIHEVLGGFIHLSISCRDVPSRADNAREEEWMRSYGSASIERVTAPSYCEILSMRESMSLRLVDVSKMGGEGHSTPARLHSGFTVSTSCVTTPKAVMR